MKGQPTSGPASLAVAPPPGPHDGLAAVDLGSNSFHMLIARVVGGEPVVVDRIRDQVQLGLGLDDQRRLSTEAKQRALASLQRLGQRLRGFRPGFVRAVGTNTLRAARNAGAFLREAEAALGHPIEVISGREEARLIYLGVAHTLADDAGARLVIDIGGGSTECILGERFEALEVHSLDMGCIPYSRRFFEDGALTPRAMEAAVLRARREVQTLVTRFQDIGWGEAVGASGTVRAVADVLAAAGWSHDDITYEGLQKLREAVVKAGSIAALALPGLKPDRAPIFPGGVAILCAIFESLGILRMAVSSGALREGVMYDLLGRIRHEDVRERTIRLMQKRYGVDDAQAARVERTALLLLAGAAEGWKLDRAQASRFLAWAARVHELGLAVSWAHYHRHGAYLLQNGDMPGFSRDDQALLATLVRGHRRKPPPDLFAPLPSKRERVVAARLVALLRLAVLLNRGRAPTGRLPFTVEAARKRLRLTWPKSWLEGHPLTLADLEEEGRSLALIGVELDVKVGG